MGSTDSGITIIDSADATGTGKGIAVGYIIQTTATAINPTTTFGGVAGHVAAIASFKAGASGPVLTGATVNSPGTAIVYSYTGSTPTDAHGAGAAAIIGNASCTGATGAIALAGGLGTLTITGKLFDTSIVGGSLTLGLGFVTDGTNNSPATSFVLAGSTYIGVLTVTATAGDPGTAGIRFINGSGDVALAGDHLLLDSVIFTATSGVFTGTTPLSVGDVVTASAYTAASGLFATGTALAAAPASGGNGGATIATFGMGIGDLMKGDLTKRPGQIRRAREAAQNG